MSTEDQQTLISVFASALNINSSEVTDELTYNTIPAWDSTGHMVLVAELEDSFDIMLDTDDIIDMSSVLQAKKILRKHGVSV